MSLYYISFTYLLKFSADYFSKIVIVSLYHIIIATRVHGPTVQLTYARSYISFQYWGESMINYTHKCILALKLSSLYEDYRIIQDYKIKLCDL